MKDILLLKEITTMANDLSKMSIPMLIASSMLVLLGLGIIVVVTKKFIKIKE